MSEFLETTVDKFIFRVATDRLYSRDGIWLLEAGDGRVRLGLTDYFQQRNGDVAFVHLKPIGTMLGVGEEFAELETIKANVGLVTPIAGTADRSEQVARTLSRDDQRRPLRKGMAGGSRRCGLEERRGEVA